MKHKTKIICTLGPASESPRVLRGMLRAGMDVARLNCSHAGHAWMSRMIALVRRLARERRRRIGILLDLEGPRIRIGRLKGGGPLELRRGELVGLRQGDFAGEGDLIPLEYPGPLADLKGASHLFIDDGSLCLTVHSAGRREVRARVVVGGALKEHKGVNIPGVRLSVPDVTDKDRRDIEFGVRERMDMIAQSFVRRRKAVDVLRTIVGERLPGCAMVAKIENEAGIRNLGGIVRAADGVMVARGDLGVSLPVWEVPILQKEIIARCGALGTFAITATQMLESMVENARPTRAEVSDIANAILDGTDYVMLSAETAVGKYPVEAVRMMNHVIRFTERSGYCRPVRGARKS